MHQVALARPGIGNGHFQHGTHYDSVRLLDEARYRDLRPVIPGHARRKRKRRIDRGLYGLRYWVEVFFHNLVRVRVRVLVLVLVLVLVRVRATGASC